MTHMHKIVREQLQLLFDVGHSHRTVGEATGSSRSVIGKLVYEDREISPKIFAAVMSLEVRPPWDTPGVVLTDKMLIPAAGTVRRLQALARMGYSVPKISEGIKVNEDYLRILINSDPSVTVRVETSRKVSRFYRTALTNIPASKSLGRTQRWAESKGWQGAGAWDDIDRDEGPVMEGDLGVLVDFVRDWPGLTTTGLQQKIRTELGMQGTLAAALIKEALALREIERVRDHRSVRVYVAG